jgi:sulfite exporter TauE/SafE
MKRTTPLAGWLYMVVAVVLVLSGVVMLFTGPSSALAFSLVAVGAALTAIVQTNKRRRHQGT